MQTQYLSRNDGHRLAYTRVKGDPVKTSLVWLSGFNSDMQGTKTLALAEWAETTTRPYIAFDYFGHGQSSGEFRDGTISRWREDCLAVIDELTDGPIVLVGSSMGGWMALLSALARRRRVAGLVLIAPAPDFTQKLMWPEFSKAAREAIQTRGVYMRPSEYGDPYPISRDLIEDGAKWSLLDDDIALDIPVRILQGMQDPDVPWDHAFRMVNALSSEDLVFSLIKDGDHRLSRPQDIERLIATVEALCTQLETTDT